MTISNQPITDRNFDDIADHFEKKVYGGLKGDIRLAVLRNDLLSVIDDKHKALNRKLRILDVGAGFAQISLQLAQLGHDVTINDISANMLEKAKQQVADTSLVNKIQWFVCPYQKLENNLTGHYDIILCHAVLEWLAQPEEFINFSNNWLAKDGYLSLCFYNPASFIYRNLIMGNFRLLENTSYQSDNKKSLTPNNPVDRYDVYSWLAAHDMSLIKESGLRVFHDYSPLKRGGHTNPDDVIKMEVTYSTQEPFKWLGRYLHILAQKN